MTRIANAKTATEPEDCEITISPAMFSAGAGALEFGATASLAYWPRRLLEDLAAEVYTAMVRADRDARIASKAKRRTDEIRRIDHRKDVPKTACRENLPRTA
jgi:hypothetical protein